jgi:beta-lactamase regulating signal transducer with metallopeptidase domain/uncharacterized membrane protein YkoI
MRISSELLLTFLLNACWQIALIAALAAIGSRLLQHSRASYRHWLWVSALCLALLVPATTSFRALFDTGSAPTSIANVPLPTEPFRRRFDEAAQRSPVAAASVSTSTFQLNQSLAVALIVLYCGFLFYRSLKLVQAWQNTRTIRRFAVELEPNDRVAEIIGRCEREVGASLPAVRVLRSETLPVPVTVGLFHPLIILPEPLLREGNTDLLTSAIGHEFIHVARRDYLLNFIYELLFVPISFHPAAALLRRRVKQTRELCCDELVAERILNAEVYARSLVRLASSAPPLRRLSVTTTVGIADADILEARIMSLLRKPELNTRWKKPLLVAVSLLLLLPCVAAAAFAMRFEMNPNAQDPGQQEERRKEKLEQGAREARTVEGMKERMASDPEFSREVQRKMEVEMEMRSIKQAALVRLARLNMDQAIQIATSQQPGKVLMCSLDARGWEEPGKLAKDGVVFYHVIIADEANAGGATHVWVNALDGAIMKSEKELPRKMRSPEQ